MSSSIDPYKFYRELIDDEFVRNSFEELGIARRNRVFNSSLVAWLMIFQRLDANHTLSATLSRVRSGEFDSLLGCCGRNLSKDTSGYSQARQRLPLKFVEAAADRLNAGICALHKEQTWRGRKVYLLDGSSWTLPGTDVMRERYPSCSNQHRESHWSKIRTLHLHDLITGVALRPAYGPMHGSEAVGEITLVPELFERLPEGSTVVGDRLLGCFRVLHAATRRNCTVLVRLPRDRANKFLKDLKKPGVSQVVWTPTKAELRKYPNLSSDESIAGRFIWYRLERDGYKPQDFYFFTTCTESAKILTELYSLRWNVETDLRSIKHTIALSRITSKSPDMIAKEFILGQVAYNLIRNIIAIAAQIKGVEPRKVSFAAVANEIMAAAPHLLRDSPAQAHDRFVMLVRDLHQFMLPNRKKRRPAEPKKVLLRRKGFGYLKLPRKLEREILENARKAA